MAAEEAISGLRCDLQGPQTHEAVPPDWTCTAVRALATASLLVVATLPLAAGCSPGPEQTAPWQLEADSAAIVELAEPADLCQDCIYLEQEAVLGDTVGLGYLEYLEDVIQDSLGRYWVGQLETVKVFDPQGRFVTAVGRAGHGPMEFGYAKPIYTDARGNVHVLDIATETTVSPDFELVDTRQLQMPQPEAIAAFPTSDRYALSMWSFRGAMAGFPLHVMEGTLMTTSFGAPDPPITDSRVMPFSLHRVLTVGASNRIYSAKRYEYDVELWTENGRRIVGFAGPTLNDPPALPDPITLDNPPPTSIKALQEDTKGRLWILIEERRSDWRNGVDPVEYRGRPGLRVKNGLEAIYRGRIDVIDPSTATVVARWIGNPHLIAFAGKGLVVEDQRLEDGTPRAVVWRVRINPDA